MVNELTIKSTLNFLEMIVFKAANYHVVKKISIHVIQFIFNI